MWPPDLRRWTLLHVPRKQPAVPLPFVAYCRAIAKWLALRAQRESVKSELTALDAELFALEDHLIPLLRLGPAEPPTKSKLPPLDRLEKLTGNPDRLREGARYFDRLASEHNQRRADRHYE
jgi:hypothetical protein